MEGEITSMIVKMIPIFIIILAIPIGIWLSVDAFMAYVALAHAVIIFPPAFLGNVGKDRVEGSVVLTWNAVPSLRQRRIFAFCVAVFVAFVLFAASRGWYSVREFHFLRTLTVMGGGFLVVFLPRMNQRRYTITDRGLWCAVSNPLGNLESERSLLQRCLYWDDVASFDSRKEKVVIYLKSPARLPKAMRAVEIHYVGIGSKHMPGITPELREEIIAHIGAHC